MLKLKFFAKKRGTIVKLLPSLIHKHNPTRLDFKKDTIYWYINWVFPSSDNLRISEENVSENEKLCSILSKYFCKQESEYMQKRLECYQCIGLKGIKVLLKGTQKQNARYFELDLSSSVKENLRNKIIIEYPTFYIVKADHVDYYSIIDSGKYLYIKSRCVIFSYLMMQGRL